MNEPGDFNYCVWTKYVMLKWEFMFISMSYNNGNENEKNNNNDNFYFYLNNKIIVSSCDLKRMFSIKKQKITFLNFIVMFGCCKVLRK